MVPVGHWHVPPVHTCVLMAQSVPVPHDGPPGQMFAMFVPQATVAGLVVGQRGVQMQLPDWQVEGEVQTRPHVPQLELSVLVLTQRLLHTD